MTADPVTSSPTSECRWVALGSGRMVAVLKQLSTSLSCESYMLRNISNIAISNSAMRYIQNNLDNVRALPSY